MLVRELIELLQNQHPENVVLIGQHAIDRGERTTYKYDIRGVDLHLDTPPGILPYTLVVIK